MRIFIPACWLFGMLLLFSGLSLLSFFDHDKLELISPITRVLQALDLPIDKAAALGLQNCWMYTLIALATLGFHSLRSGLLSTELCVTADSIIFPTSFAASVHWRLQRLWQDVSYVTATAGLANSSGCLVVFFKTGGKASID